MKTELERMAQDLAMTGYAETTQKSYLKTARHLQARFGCSPSQLSRDDLRHYVDELIAQGKSASWLTMELGALKFLYRKTLGQDTMVSFISFPRKHSPLPEVLSLKEVDRLLRAIRSARYQAVAMVLYGAGLRIREALRLEVRDIDGARGVIRVRKGKGGKPRETKLSQSLYLWLRDYWSRVQPSGALLFASPTTGKAPETSTIRTALAKAAKEAGIKKRVTPHVLRHSWTYYRNDDGRPARAPVMTLAPFRVALATT